METKPLDLADAENCRSLPMGGETAMPEVNVQDSETLESALRRFKSNVEQEDIIQQIKRLSFCSKPSETARAKQSPSINAYTEDRQEVT
jgi:small subunit ribosomal protein S21